MTYSRIGVGAGRRVASVVDHHDLEIPDRLAERGVDRFLEEYGRFRVGTITEKRGAAVMWICARSPVPVTLPVGVLVKHHAARGAEGAGRFQYSRVDP